MLTSHLRKKNTTWHFSFIICLSFLLFTNVINKSSAVRCILGVLIEGVLFIEISMWANSVPWLQIMGPGFPGRKHCVHIRDASEPAVLSADATASGWPLPVPTATAWRATDARACAEGRRGRGARGLWHVGTRGRTQHSLGRKGKTQGLLSFIVHEDYLGCLFELLIPMTPVPTFIEIPIH